MSAVTRALVLGLDGLPLSLARGLAAGGVLPGLGELFSSGTLAELLAPVPEVSSTSWTTFLTGADPARHGIYGFTDLKPHSYDVYFPNLTHTRGPLMWDHLGRAGLRMLSLNVPGTYPAPPMAGAVVSGFVAPDPNRAVSPARLGRTLSECGYQIDVEVGDAAQRPHAFLDRLHATLDGRVRAFTRLLREEQWDVAVAVITETDRLQHLLWGEVVNRDGELHKPIMDFYRAVDAAVTALVAAVPSDTDLYLISDHGFGPADCQFHANAWLREQDWLAPLSRTPSLRELDRSSSVFALDPARFYVNRTGRFPAGSVSAADAERLVEELCARLRALRRRGGEIGPDLDGPPLLAAVYRREEIYRGPLLEQAPDVVAVPAAGVQLRGAWKPAPEGAGRTFTGTHTRADAIFWSSRRDIDAELVDMVAVAPTVLGGVGLHPALDGRDLGAPTPTGPPSSPARYR